MIRKRFVWKMRDREITLGDRTLIVAILNVTPDSFSDGGLYQDPDRAYARALELESLGADIIDIGAESTRPGSERISEAEELRRLVPVLKRLRGHLTIPLCVDTYKAAVAAKALELGVEIINDPSGLTFDPQLAKVVANADAALILNHMRGTPETWSRMPPLKNPMGAVCNDLAASVHRAIRFHVDRMRLAVDPGLGFGKRKEENSRVLAELPQLAKLLDLPVMVGPSRKSFLRQETDLETTFASAAAVVASVLNGAHMVRVHDVKEMAAAARIADNILLAEREIPVETPAPRRKFGAPEWTGAGRGGAERRAQEKPSQDFPRMAPTRPAAARPKAHSTIPAPALAAVAKVEPKREPEVPAGPGEVQDISTGITVDDAAPVAPTVQVHAPDAPPAAGQAAAPSSIAPPSNLGHPSGDDGTEADPVREEVREELDEFDVAQEDTDEDQTDLDDLVLEEEDEDVYAEDLDEEDFDAEIMAELESGEEDLEEEPATRPAAPASREPAIKLPKVRMPLAAKPVENKPAGKPHGPARFQPGGRRSMEGRRGEGGGESEARGGPRRGASIHPLGDRGRSDRRAGTRGPKGRDGGGWTPIKRTFDSRKETPPGSRGSRPGANFGDRPPSDHAGSGRPGSGRQGDERAGGEHTRGGRPRDERPSENRGRGNRADRFDGPRRSPEDRPTASGPRGGARKGAFSSKPASSGTAQGRPPKGKSFDRPFKDRPPRGKFTGKSSGKSAKGKGVKGRPKGFRPGQR